MYNHLPTVVLLMVYYLAATKPIHLFIFNDWSYQVMLNTGNKLALSFN